MQETTEGKARLAKIRSEIAFRRHATARAAGKPAIFGEMTAERLEALRVARLGKPHNPETKTAIGEGVKAAHGAKVQARYDAITSRHGMRNGAMVRAIEERKP